MQIDVEVYDAVSKDIAIHLQSLQEELDRYLIRLKQKEFKSVEEFMRAKEEIMIDIVTSLPLGSRSCYFCVKHGFQIYTVKVCDKCEYGKIHGICPNQPSTYRSIEDAKSTLVKELREYTKYSEHYNEHYEEVTGNGN